MIKVEILIGISGAGKSTYCKQKMSKDKSFLRINRDDIRTVITGTLKDYYLRKDLADIEEIVTKQEDLLFEQYSIIGKNILIDATHLTPTYLSRWLDYSKIGGYDFSFTILDIDPEISKQRVMDRDDLTLKQVKYIDKQYEQYKGVIKYLEKIGFKYKMKFIK